MNQAFKLLIATLSVAAGSLWLNMAHAASFDCAKARTKVEKLICADPFISRLDGQLGKVYDKDIAKANPKQKKRLVTEERDWLKNMRDLCTTQTCFKHAYWQRLAELETFYVKKVSPIIAQDSNKSTIHKILNSITLYQFPLNYKECPALLSSVRSMKDIHFIKPKTRGLSYGGEHLDAFRKRVAHECSVEYPQKAPVDFEYKCDPQMLRMAGYSMGGKADSTLKAGGLRVCDAYYGLPPFMVYVLPPFKGQKERRYIFHYSDAYGPMNRTGSPTFGLSGESHFLQILPACGHEGGRVSYVSGMRGIGRSSYSGVFKHAGEFYYFMLIKLYAGYTLKINPVVGKLKSGCSWSTIK